MTTNRITPLDKNEPIISADDKAELQIALDNLDILEQRIEKLTRAGVPVETSREDIEAERKRIRALMNVG